MNLRQLECFTAVMATGTMTAAARQIRTSQPAVSNLIAKLEHDVGFSLFKRQKGRLVPTPEAHHFYRVAERIVSDMQGAREAAVQIADGKFGQVTIATLPGLGLNLVPSAIRDMRKDRPDTRFRILTRSTEAVRMMIPSEQCDVAIIDAPVEIYSGLTERLRFECVAVLPKHHSLARHDVLTPKLLFDQPLVTLFPEHPTTIQLQQAYFADQTAWRPVVESRFFATSCELVGQGAGVSVVDPITAHWYSSKVVARPFLPQIILELAVTLPGEGPHSRLARDFVKVLTDQAEPFRLSGN